MAEAIPQHKQIAMGKRTSGTQPLKKGGQPKSVPTFFRAKKPKK